MHVLDAFMVASSVYAAHTERMTLSKALWTVGPGQMVLYTENLPFASDERLLLRGLYSGVSRGTERLVLQGRVPETERETMRCPFQEGDFPFPVKYGYAFVGMPTNGPPEQRGRPVFALSPHQEFAWLPQAAIIPLPERLPPRRAALAANMETALNVVWDAEVGPGDRVLVVGAGVVGLLIAYLAARIPGVQATVADLNPSRRALAERLGIAFCTPPDGPADVDVAINASASGAGLAYALAGAGMEARVVEASWYGDGVVQAPLGAAFHARRLALISSQVGRVPAKRAARWTHRRRLAMALDLLAEAPALDALITHEIPLAETPDRLPKLLDAETDALCIAIRYTAEED